ncbi:hypothetical protein BDZ45DRAFT_750046 [Acephala macrosclerotiorum]|nr:hypothetical protein BDZ45DRAFT_750046 [Acephala macrosclerotiorum]
MARALLETLHKYFKIIEEPTPVVVWGGGLSVGAYNIQLAHKYSIPVVTVCGLKHFELCKSLGAIHVFDYHDEDVISEIKSVAPNIGSETSSTSFKADAQKEEEEGDSLHLWAVFLKDHQYKDSKWPASEADHNLGIELFQAIPE